MQDLGEEIAKRGISAVGSARHSHCRGQGFESPMLHHKALVNQGFFFFTFLLKHNNYLTMAKKFKHSCQYPILQNSCFGACIFEVFSFYWCHSRFSFKRQDFFVLIALADIALPLFVAEEIKIKVVLKIISLFVCYNPKISFLSNLCQYPAEVFSYAPVQNYNITNQYPPATG